MQAYATFSGLSMCVQCKASVIMVNLANLPPFLVFRVEYLPVSYTHLTLPTTD